MPGNQARWYVVATLIILSIYWFHDAIPIGAGPRSFNFGQGPPPGHDPMDLPPQSYGGISGRGPLNVQERMLRSERQWSDQVSQRRVNFEMRGGPANTPMTDTKFTLWDFFTPAYTCPHEMERVGHLGDGGKWICGMSKYEEYSRNPANPPLIIYSLGINEDSAWEAMMMDRTNAHIYGYDFSVQDFAVQVLSGPYEGRTNFFPYAIDKVDIPKDPQGIRHATIQTLMEENGHSYMDILKIDIEGFEHDSMNAFMEHLGSTPLPIGQMLIELHGAHSGENPERWAKLFDDLESHGMRATYNEVNLWPFIYGDAKWPNAIEYTMINVHIDTVISTME